MMKRLGLLLLLCCTPAWAAFPAGWGRKAEIQIPGSKIGGLACLTQPYLLTEANLPAEIFSNTDNGGGDLRFSSDAAGTTQLSLDVVTFNTGTSKAQLYVLATLCPTVTTNSIYVWYKNTGQTQPAAGAAFGSQSAYDSNTKLAVHHEVTSPTDATVNANNGTASGGVMSVAGQIGNANSFNGSTGKISFGTSTSLQFTNAFTVEAIAKPSATNQQGWVASRTLFTDIGYAMTIDGSGHWQMNGGYANSSYAVSFNSTTAPSTSRYDYLVFKNSSGAKVSKAEPTNNITHACQGQVVYGGYVWSVGGYAVGGSTSAPGAYLQQYNPANDTWAQGTAAGTPAWGCAMVLVGSIVYKFGGNTTGNVATGVCEKYDLSLGLASTWSACATLPAALQGQGIEACYANSNVYLFYNNGSDQAQLYDTVGNSYTAKTASGINGGTWPSAIGVGNYCYLFDGSNTRQYVMRYDAVNNSWNTTYAQLPYKMWAAALVYDGTKVWFSGGRNGTKPMSRAMYSWDLTAGTSGFTQYADDTCEGDAYSVGWVSNKFYMFGRRQIGGPDPGTLSAGYAGSFDTSTHTWDTTCPMYELYVNGVYENGLLSNTALHASTQAFAVGAQASGAVFFPGIVDEVRASNIARPAGYALTMNNNLMSPGTFATAQTPTTPSSGSAAGANKTSKLEKLD